MEKKVKFLQIITVILAVALIAITVTFSVLLSQQSDRCKWFDASYKSQNNYCVVYGSFYNSTNELLYCDNISFSKGCANTEFQVCILGSDTETHIIAPKETVSIRFLVLYAGNNGTTYYEVTDTLDFDILYRFENGKTKVLCSCHAVFD